MAIGDLCVTNDDCTDGQITSGDITIVCRNNVCVEEFGGAPRPSPTPTPSRPTPTSTPITCEGLGLTECGFFEEVTNAGCLPGFTCEQYAPGIFCCTPPPEPTPTPTPPAPCPVPGTFSTCVNPEGFDPLTGAPLNALVFTGRYVNGECERTLVYNSDCVVCEPAGTFIQCAPNAPGSALYSLGYANSLGICETEIKEDNTGKCQLERGEELSTTVKVSPDNSGTLFVSSRQGTTPPRSGTNLTAEYIIGEIVDVEVKPNSGFEFVQWDLVKRDGTVVRRWSTNTTENFSNTDNVQELIAVFSRREIFSTTVTANPNNFGTVSASSRQGTTPPRSGTNLTVNYVNGEAVDVTASPNGGQNGGFQFIRWDLLTRDDILVEGWSTNLSAGFLDTNVKSLTAIFSRAPTLTPTPTPTPPPSPPATPSPIICTPPTGPFERTIRIPCTDIDRQYSGGEALQSQTLQYDALATNLGPCPSEWVNVGLPDVTTCISPVFYRNCVTGELIEGTPPPGFVETNFTGPGGGTCWEPLSDLGFTPSLQEALRFVYQRGSSKYPEGKNITVTNPSYGIAYRVTITTNPDVKLRNRRLEGNASISFIVPPRSSEIFTINITPTLLEKLQDGVSTLAMAVDYERVIS